MADPLSGGMNGAMAGSSFGPYGALIGGGLGMLGGGLFGGASNPEDLWRQYLAQLPSYQTLLSAGQTGPSAFGSISEDPTLRTAQLGALQQLQGVANQQGLGLQDQVALNQAMQRTGEADRGNREAVLQQMAMRGQGGSGQELLGKLMGGQAATQANASAGAQATSDARNRALQAMGASGGLAGNIRGQEFQQNAQRASAEDAINQFNAANRLNAYGMRMGALGQGYQGMAGGSNEQYQRGVAAGGAGGAALGGLAQYGLGTRGGSGSGVNPGSGYTYTGGYGNQEDPYKLQSSWPGGYGGTP